MAESASRPGMTGEAEVRDAYIGSPGRIRGVMLQAELGGATPAATGAVTMEAIGELLRKEIAPMRESIGNLEGQLGRLQIDINEQIKGVDDKIESASTSVDKRLGEMGMRIDACELRVSKLEEVMDRSTSHELDNKAAEQSKELEKQMMALRQGGPIHAMRECTAVIGGLSGFDSKEAAATWVRNKLWTLWGPQPVDVYSKGDFRNLMFFKIETKSERDDAMQLFQNAGLKEGGNDVWAKEDLPIEVRARKSFLLGLKYMLKGWKFERIKVDDDFTSLTVGSDKVIEVTCAALTMTFKWLDSWSE